MKKAVLIIIMLASVANFVNGQITKGNWMVGGNGMFSSQIEDNPSFNNVKATIFKLSPNVGYFFIDKFAAGIKPEIGSNKLEYNAIVSKSNSFALGPFLRYYFLDVEKQFNLFGETSYQFSQISGNNVGARNQNAFTLSAGSVIYFNSSVGLEFALNYRLLNIPKEDVSAKTFFVTAGFQIHLERDNK